MWERDGVGHIQPVGDGANIIKYLGANVSRTAISDSRILADSESTDIFYWKDCTKGDVRRVETLLGTEFVACILGHVLPTGLRAIRRRYGFCHLAVRLTRERITFHSGLLLVLGDSPPPQSKPAPLCSCCKKEMVAILRIAASWNVGRSPPPSTP